MSIYKLSFILVLAYVILLGRPVYEEISLEPGWSADMVSGSSGSFPVDSADFIPFKFSGHFGYYLPSGKIPYNDEILYDTAIDEKGFINFSSINKNLILRSPDGSVTGMVEAVGYPFFLQQEGLLSVTMKRLLQRWMLTEIYYGVIISVLLLPISLHPGLL